MALDPRIALAGQQVAPVDPNEEAVKAGQASDALALARQRIQSRQDDAAFATAMQQAGGDPDKAITLLQTTNPRAALTYGSMITKQRQDNLKLAMDQSDFLGKQTDAALKLFQGVGNDPKQYQIALRGAFGILHDTPAGEQLANLPQNPTPDEIPGLVDGILQKGMSAKDYHEQITSGLKTWLGGDPVAGLAHMLEVTDDPQMRQSIIQSAKAHGAPDAFVTAATSLSNQVAAGADPKTFRQLLGPQNPIKLGANETLIDPNTNQPVFRAGPAPMTPYQEEELKLRQGELSLAQQREKRESGQASNLDIGPEVETTALGNKWIDLGKYGTTERATARTQAEKSGATVISDKNAASHLRDIETARMNQQAVLNDIESSLPRDASGRLLAQPGILMSKVLQTDEARAAFNSWRTTAIGTLKALAGGQGSGLRINQAEINMSLANDIPQLTDTLGTAQKKASNIKTQLDNAERGILGVKAPSGGSSSTRTLYYNGAPFTVTKQPDGNWKSATGGIYDDSGKRIR